MGKGFAREFKKNRQLFFMFLPAAVFFFVFAYMPMPGLIIAFKDFDYIGGIFFSKWNGLNNFRFFVISGKLLEITLNTAKFNLIFFIVNTCLEIITAIILAELGGKIYKKACQSITFLPHFVSWVVVSAFAYNFLNYEIGAVNGLIRSVGAQPVDFYSKGWYWHIILPIISAWKHVGYGTIIYLAAIKGIDQEIYEAAEIDGASIFQQIKKITVPLLIPTTATLALLRLGRILRGDFEMFYQLIGRSSLIYKQTDVIDTFVFRSLVNVGDIGMSSAAGFYQSVVCFITIIAVNQIVKRVNGDYALF